MNNFTLLIDTNIFIGLEDPKKVDPALAALVRRCAEHSVKIFVHEDAVLDIARDKDIARREISLSKIDKFPQLCGVYRPTRADLEVKFGAIKKPNDEVDIALLQAVDCNAVDFLVTEDRGISDRVKLSPLAGRIMTVGEALVWLNKTFDPTPVDLPFIVDMRAHEFDLKDPIFDSLRDGYPGFDEWWKSKCAREHRHCWAAIISDNLAGLIVRKDERHSEALTTNVAEKILKICTFKVRPEYRGEKLGEQLLKQALWYAQRNGYQLIYVTTFPSQSALIQLLEYFGFCHTQTAANGEYVYEKPLSSESLHAETLAELSELARINYPRFSLDAPSKIFAVPVQGAYHAKLFPEIAYIPTLPLFPNESRRFSTRGDRTPGNTIRKVYLCRANTQELVPGAILLFYQSKTPGFDSSQSLTSVGVVERVSEANDLAELVRLTAKRSVFSELELQGLLGRGRGPIRVIDFLLSGHFEPAIPLSDLVELGVFNRHPPQSISQLAPARVAPLKARASFGFDLA